MDQEIDNLIPIDAPKSNFERFLEIKNKRIFFSGKFGIGKTFFLQKFFEEHKEKYDVYHLFPVRYQIASNENIIELLKYDILVELLNKHSNAFQNNEVNGISGWSTLVFSYLKERTSVNGFLQSSIEAGESALAFSPDPLCQLLGQLGRPLKDLLNIDKEFQEFKRKYLAGDKQIVNKFIEETKQSVDSIANDYLSHLLRGKIAEMKTEKKSVLILDDFDRIDPEHIFRILNVLSAHMEGDEDNKFGFDYVIVVGDIKNIKSIFHHKYGTQTEFWGYLDKFFTVRPYEFDNNKAVAERIPFLLKNFRCENSGLKDAFGESGITKHLLQEVLVRALDVREMNLRQLYKPINYSFPEIQNSVYRRDSFTDGRNLCIDVGIKLLIALYGEKEHFIVILKKIRDVSSASDIKNSWLFAEYSSSMIKRMLSLEPNSKISWLNKYSVSAAQDGSIRLEGGVKIHARFFYDTLLEYVVNSKYEKQDIYDYEK